MCESKIFRDVVKLPADQRADYLDQACGDNVQLRSDVESLLRSVDDNDSFLKSPVQQDRETTETMENRMPILEGPGSTVGPYRLKECIGEGGFGLVFVAQQQRPVRRKVALKIIKPGMDTNDVVARFEVERQALALMDHPNIAKVLDAGTTETGRPYFVMELIKGIPIVEYCDNQELSATERVKLFVSVCRAVQHAHTKGIIHRDLKPSNILVSPHDGIPVVKVIDFGIAKAIGQQLTDKTIYTNLAQMVGTPLYMSPEQAEINALDVDIRSDVYSLGVLLYELLTGTTPFDRERFSSAAYDEIKRIIREEEPPTPSHRLSTLGESISAVSKQRKTDPSRLTATVKGDLDWIVMCCLEKDRTRRYQTAASLTDDLERFLENEPVNACPPSTAYRIRKYVRRHRTFLAVATSFVLLALIAVVAIGWQSWTVSRQAKLYRSLLEDHRDSQLAAAYDFALDGRLDTTREIAGKLEKTLVALDPSYSQGAIKNLLDGIAYFYSGQVEESKQSLDDAVRLAPKNFVAQAMHARIVLNVGDWPTFLDEAAKLKLPENASYHEKLFFWQSQMGLNHTEAAKQLGDLVRDRERSSFVVALEAAANLGASMDEGNVSGILRNLDLAIEAIRIDPNNTHAQFVVVNCYVHALRFAETLGLNKQELRQQAEPHVQRLAETYKEHDGPGHYVLADYYRLKGEPDKAAYHWVRCPWPDVAAAALSNDRREADLKAADRKWGATDIAELNRILIGIEKLPRDTIVERYARLASKEKHPIFRLACLQILLRLREPELAKQAADALLADPSLRDGEIPHLVLPLKLIAAESENDRKVLVDDAFARQHGATNVLVHYWHGHAQLADGNVDDAIQSFDNCVNAGVFGWTYQYWAECLRNRLMENRNWPLVDE